MRVFSESNYNEVVYKLIENLSEFREMKRKEIEKDRLMSLNTLCKIKILHQYIFIIHYFKSMHSVDFYVFRLSG